MGTEEQLPDRLKYKGRIYARVPDGDISVYDYPQEIQDAMRESPSRMLKLAYNYAISGDEWGYMQGDAVEVVAKPKEAKTKEE